MVRNKHQNASGNIYGPTLIDRCLIRQPFAERRLSWDVYVNLGPAVWINAGKSGSSVLLPYC